MTDLNIVTTDPVSGKIQEQSFPTSLDSLSSSGSAASQAQTMQQYLSMLQDIQDNLDDYNSDQDSGLVATVQSDAATNIATLFDARAEASHDPSQNTDSQAMMPFDISQLKG